MTGAGQGVGRSVALRFAENNAGGVVVNDFRMERAEAVAAEVEKLGVKALPVQCDVTDFASVTAMFEQAKAKFGGVDILVNNAGNAGPDPSACRPQTILGTGAEGLGRLHGHQSLRRINCVRIAGSGDDQAKKYGKLVTVISDAGRVGEPQLEIYSGAKAGAAGFMRAIAKQPAATTITANCVALGTTMTPAIDRGMTDPEAASGFSRSTKSSVSASLRTRPT